MVEETTLPQRRYDRIFLPHGMFVVWYGDGEQGLSRVRTLGMGGLFISNSNPRPVGTKLILIFEVPRGSVQAEGIARSIVPAKGMGVEFTWMNVSDRILLEGLLKRALQ